ncbi:MAG: hypothetical protein DMF89_25700 [Acidobacteria bacterium]|nr:MAG: hypothetical protein DMF89_25700 [Acidobacteriota bacterium]
MHQRQQNQTTTETVRDIELKCSNCGIPFVWTIGEQICWAQYAESQGQAPWPAPRRCQECRRDLKPNSRPNAPPTRGLESDGRSAGSPRRHSGRARQHPGLFSLIRWVARPTATQASPTRRFRCAKPDVRESDDPLTDGTRRRVLARLHRDKERRRDRAHLHVPDDATIQQAIDDARGEVEPIPDYAYDVHTQKRAEGRSNEDRFFRDGTRRVVAASSGAVRFGPRRAAKGRAEAAMSERQRER